MVMSVVGKDPYGFDLEFEKAVVTLCASRSRFWARIGYALDPDCMGIPESKLVLQTCALINREVGHGPSSTMILLQRLRRLMNDGKVTVAQIQAVSQIFDDAEDHPYGLPSEDDVVAELAPLLKRRMHSAAVMLSHDEYAKRGDFTKVIDTIQRAERLGKQESSIGTIVGPAAFSEIDAMSSLVRLPSGVLDLDLQMADGLHRGGLGVALGGSGDGKSMWLTHQAAEGVRSKLFVGKASLELPKPVQLARLFANLTGIPTNQILENPNDRKEAQRRMAVMAPHVGACVVEEFPPHATTVADIIDWCDRCADMYGRPFDLLSIDYGDKLYHPMKGGDNEYIAMRYVYEGMRRDIAVAKNMWVWTAAQGARPSKDQGKRLELHHVSDSMHKVRVADLVITLNARDDGAQLLYFVAKNRLGKSRFQVGPIPTDFERARVVPASSEWADWSQV